jgi:hypothetical protein
MKLFNKTIDRQLFKQYSLGSDLSKQEVVVKIFNPFGAGTWFILNSDPEDPDYLWAIVDLGYGAEVGSVSRSELENYRGRFGLGFERDLGFDPINAEELYQGLRNGEYYADGGQIQVVYERSVGSKKPIKLLLLNKGKEQKGYTFSGKDQVAVLENYNRNKQEDLEKIWNLKGYETKYADGGDIAEFSDNQQMIMNQNVEVEHHHEELEDILEDKIEVPAWVVAKMETATQNLSDITHYLDGQKEIMEDQLEGDDNDDDDDDEMKMEEVENKEVVEPIFVTAGTKTDLTKKFTDDAFGNLKGFLKGMEGIDLREDYTFDYKDEQYEIEPIVNSDENGVSNAVFTIFDGDGEEVGEVTYSSEGGKQKFTANSELFVWNDAKFEDGGFMADVYAKGGSVKKDWWQTVVNPNEDFHNYDNRKPIDWEVDDFKEWVVSNSDLDGNVDKEVLDVIKMPKSKLTVDYLNENGSGKNNDEYYKEFGNWQSALYDIFTQMKKDYLEGKSSSKKPKYILKADIKTVTVKRNGKEITYKGADVLNGANVLAKGGDLTSKANYIPKRDVVEVELKDGSKVKPVNGYWVKKGAEPVGVESTPTSSGKSGSKISETYIRKDMRGNWKAETTVDDFNGYDWRISTIKTYSGKVISSAQGGKTEATGSKGIQMFKYTMYEDPNYTLEVSQPSRLTEKVVTEQHNKALAKFKKFMETGTFGKGGKISKFDKLSAKVAKQYEGKPVKSEYQEEYGKYYSKEEAQEVGDKVAGKVKAMQSDKKEIGGTVKKKSSAREMLIEANQLAKKIRKDGESWNDAKKRAFAQLKK